MKTTFRKVALVPGLAVLLAAGAGCDRIGSPMQALGARIPPPDEFAVIKRRPLAMPPALGLPEPRPGAPSPLDPAPEREAAAALLGPGAATAGQPTAREITRAEASLLESASAAAASNDVRVELAEDADRRERDRTYVPPTLLERLGFSDPPPIPEEEQLQPVVEAQRLQRTGIAAPNDPAALPPEPEAPGAAAGAGSDEFEPYVAPRQQPRPVRF